MVNTELPEGGIELAEGMFNAYGEHCGWKTFDGRDMPRWADITDLVRSHWREAADYAYTMLVEEKVNTTVVEDSTVKITKDVGATE